MGSYTIQSGDTLWGIVKKQFNLSSNKDIANKIKEVAAKNGISNPNRIFAGKTLDLDLGTGVTLERESSQEQSVEEKMAELTQAQKAAQEQIKVNTVETTEELNELDNSPISLWGNKEVTEEEKITAYKEYSDFLLKNYYDKNGDGEVTIDEFAEKESENELKALTLDSRVVIDDEETAKLYQTIALRTGNLFAGSLDINRNGVIETEELAFFYRDADSNDGKYDGIISGNDEERSFNGMLGLVDTSKEYKDKYEAVINKYLLGETLSQEEEKLFAESQAKIRIGIGKAYNNSPFAPKN